MHVKKIIKLRPSARLPIIIGLATCVLLLSNNSVAQQNAQPNQEAPPPIPSAGSAEYKIKKLPNDTFKPSEKISEDFPVPFPVDI